MVKLAEGRETDLSPAKIWHGLRTFESGLPDFGLFCRTSDFLSGLPDFLPDFRTFFRTSDFFAGLPDFLPDFRTFCRTSGLFCRTSGLFSELRTFSPDFRTFCRTSDFFAGLSNFFRIFLGEGSSIRAAVHGGDVELQDARMDYRWIIGLIDRD